MLYLFDLDGTLITSYMDREDKNFDKWDVLPARVGVMNLLQMQGHDIAIITNQAGVAFGHVTQEQVDEKLRAVLRALHVLPMRSDGDPPPVQAYCCLHHPDAPPPWNDPDACLRRKPCGEMIREAVQDHRSAAFRGVLYVGDRSEDEEAADDAGVPFRWADEFFSAGLAALRSRDEAVRRGPF